MDALAPPPVHSVALLRARAVGLVAARPSLSLAVAGFAASSLTVLAGGHVGTNRSVIPLSTWLGLLSYTGSTAGDYRPGAAMLLGLVALVLLWIVAIKVNRPERCPEHRIWWIAGVWALPFIAGPPLISNDVYTYAAQGLMVRDGFNPYQQGPSVLGNIRAVAAVDPNWRSVTSPYGPLATVFEHLAVAISGGSAIGAVVVFRGAAVVSTIAIGILAANLAGPRRVQALTLTVLNPLLLVHVVSAAHLDGIMCALLLGSLVAANQRRWTLAIVLGCAAGMIKAPALAAVLAVICVHALGRARARAVRTAARDVAVAALSVAALTLPVHDGWGWIHNLNTPALGHTSFAPASLIGDLFAPVVHSASFDDLATAGRITALLAAAAIVVYLTATAQTRALNRTVGYGLLAIALLSPVLYPWYLLWAVVCLVPTARATRADWLILISALGCLLTPVGFSSAVSELLTVLAALVALVWIGVRLLKRNQEAASPVSGVG